MSIQAISKLTGWDRKTIRKYVQAAGVAPEYGPRSPQSSKLDAFKPYLEERLGAGVWNARVLLRELRERNYTGSYTIPTDWLRPQRSSARVVAVRRFETAPGKQAQVDWGHLGTLELAGQEQKLHGFTFTFANCRLIDVGPDEIEAYLRERLCQRVKVRTSKGYRELGLIKATTVHQELRVLRRMFNVAARKKLLTSNPCAMVEFPVPLEGMFRPYYVTWSEQQQIENHATPHLRNAIRIITETGLRVKKELLPMKKNQVDFLNAVLWIPVSKTPNGVAEIPLTKLALEAFRNQVAISGTGEFLFPSELNQEGHLKSLRTAWRKALKRAGVPYFRLYDLRSTYATRLSAGGVAEWVIQMLRQGDSQVFKKYSQMKLKMRREALDKINRRANEMSGVLTQQGSGERGFDTVLTQ